MDSDSDGSGHGAQDTSLLKDSLSMVIRQLQAHSSHSARAQSEEIPESEPEREQDGGDDDGDDTDGKDDNVSSAHSSEHDDGYLELPQRRHSISSAGSNYSPSSSSPEDDDGGGVYPPDQSSVRAEPDNTQEPEGETQPYFTTPSPLPFVTTLSPFATVPPTPTQTQYRPARPSPLKRPLSPSRISPRPFKRVKAPLNLAYLSLLNADIVDAATRFTPTPPTITWPASGSGSGGAAAGGEEREEAETGSPPAAAGPPPLQPSQIGLSHWTAPEKTLFFEALARLGPDDARGIAARLRTKSAFEVAAYLALLRDAAAAAAAGGGGGIREGDQEEERGQYQEQEKAGGKMKRKKDRAAAVTVVPADVPAAVELSPACVAALEEAADAVSLRQEAYEERAERRRWEARMGPGGPGGGRFWVIGPANRKAAEEEAVMPSLAFFRVGQWLRLAERVFMNSAVEEGNWRAMMAAAEGDDGDEGSRPRIRATALEDFYSLAVSLTRRLVAATAYVAESRARAAGDEDREAGVRVGAEDVKAAALSLGLKTDSRAFWAKCARRLRLEVYDVEEDGDAIGWDNEEEPMPYGEVERALGFEPVDDGSGGEFTADEEPEASEEEESGEGDEESLPDAASVDLGAGLGDESSDEEPSGEEEDEADTEDIKREINELLIYSALEYPETKRARGALKRRIRAAKAHEAYADALDARASYCEEKRLWAMLERQPPVGLTRVEAPKEPPRRTRTVDDLIRGFSRTPGRGDWRSKLEVVPSRWEMEYALVEAAREEEKEAPRNEI